MGRRAKAMQDLFLTSFKNTLILWVGNFIPQILLSLLLAVWFTDSKLHIPGVGFFKVVMYLPNIITAVSVAALFMRFISNSQLSAVNTLLMLNGGDPVSFEVVSDFTSLYTAFPTKLSPAIPNPFSFIAS